MRTGLKTMISLGRTDMLNFVSVDNSAVDYSETTP
jgi:hypothetical protein